MHSPRTPRFEEEAARFGFRFACEDCGHFDPARERCRHEWPTALHRKARLADPSVAEVVFCKEFEVR